MNDILRDSFWCRESQSNRCSERSETERRTGEIHNWMLL